VNKQEWLQYQRHNRHLSMPILSFPVVQLLGITVKDLVNNARYQALGMKKISERYPTSAAVTIMDLSVEAENFDAEIEFFDMEVPAVLRRVIDNCIDADKLAVPAVKQNRSLIYIEAVEEALRLIDDRPVFAGVIGPFSLAGRLMDMTEIMMNCYLAPDMVHTVLKKVSTYIINYIKEYKKAGAAGIIMAEPAAGLLSPELCDEFSSKYIKTICNNFKEDNFVFCYHNCGNTIPLVESIVDIDADLYHFGNSINLEEMLKLMPRNKIVMGNLDPMELQNGTMESVRSKTLNILEKCNKYPNFVISTGCDVPPAASWDNIDVYFKTIQEYYGITGI